MSHIFISYAHHDKAYLDTLLMWLKEREFTDNAIWYDEHIEGGNNWRDEISTALDDAYVIVVIVTPQSMQSLYCTYEWAYALGQGAPVLPLMFEEVSMSDVPAPLVANQFINCTEQFPTSLKEQIRQYQSVPPQVAAINRSVYDAIEQVHHAFFILGWLGNAIESLDHGMREYVKNYFVEISHVAYTSLQTILTDKAFVITGRQQRYCWKLVTFLKEFTRLQYKEDRYLQDNLYPHFSQDWLPAFLYFEPHNDYWRRSIQSHYHKDLSIWISKSAVFADIARTFPQLEPFFIDMLIDEKAPRQIRKRK